VHVNKTGGRIKLAKRNREREREREIIKKRAFLRLF